ncbi:MAG: hypothetical protein AB7L84_04555 [Acidimicrobiia bacterium]
MGAHVMVVTADLGLAELVMPQLANLGVVAVRARDVEDARQQLGPVEVLVVDSLLEGGPELAWETRTEGERHVVVIAPAEEAPSWRTGEGLDVLAEPFSIVELVAVLRAALAARAARLDNVIDLRERTAPEPWWASN